MSNFEKPPLTCDKTKYVLKRTFENELSEDSSDPILPGENPDSDFGESLNSESLEKLEEKILRESLDVVGSLDNKIEQFDSDDKERREVPKISVNNFHLSKSTSANHPEKI